MRKLIFSILLASAAASPALAQDHGRWQNESEQSPKAEAREQAREQRQEQRQEQRSEAREQRSSGGGNFDRGQQQQQPQVEVRRQQWQGNSGGGQQDQAQQQLQGRGSLDGHRRDEAQQQVVQQQQEQRRSEGRNGGSWNGGDRRNWTGSQTQQTQTNGGWARDRGSWSHDRDGDFRQRQVDQQTRDSSRWAQSGQRWSGQRYSGNWNRNWRNDIRYDWRRYRNNHRSLFNLGIYFDPFGYNYRRFDIGYRLYGAYLGQQYWIDPALYGLPYPPPGTQWVRYWNDAVLVDMYTGEVVDVIRDFFW